MGISRPELVKYAPALLVQPGIGSGESGSSFRMAAIDKNAVGSRCDCSTK